MSKKKLKFGIIGTGVVGTALAVLLENAGWECIGVNTRSRASYERFYRYLQRPHLELSELVSEADVLFLTTQDSAIEEVARKLSALKGHKPGQVWVHCSGSLRAEIMRQNPSLSVGYLSVHPLQAFADVDNALNLIEGAHFGIEGDGRETEELGEVLVKLLGGIPHKIDPGKKALYHAGAVAASNYLVSLVSLAVKLFSLAGINKEDALESLLPLTAGAYRNIEKVGLPWALTGPIARGDVEVVRKHLEEIPSELRETYKGLGRLALELGKERKALSGESYSKDTLQELEEILSV